jgi:hypothetical protein
MIIGTGQIKLPKLVVMKYIAFILTFYLCSLTIAPALVLWLPCSENNTNIECCAGNNSDCNSSDKDQNNNSTCPFSICCNNCLFYIIDPVSFEFIFHEIQNEKIISTAPDLFSTYIADCWHPPETCINC